MKINTFNKKIYGLFALIIISILFMINGMQLSNMNKYSLIFAFLLDLSLVVISWITNGFELITFILFCIILLTVPITVQFFTGNSYGLLSMGIVQLYYADFLEYTFIYCSIFLGISIISNFKNNEEKLINLDTLNLSSLNIIFNNLIAIIFTIVAFPRLTFQVMGTERFDMLLPGHAWNQLAIVALLFNLKYLKERTSVKLAYIFVICWFLLNGERADITGLVLGLFVYFLIRNKKNIEKMSHLKNILAVVCLIAFLLLLNLIINIRNGEKISLSQNLKTLITTPTISDVSYIFNVVIAYSKSFSKLNGSLFLTNIFSIIPLYNNDLFGTLMSSVYPYPGGEPWLAQPLLDWGKIGLIFSPIIDLCLLKVITLKDNRFFKMEYLAFLCLVPRAVWYGRSYTFTTLIFFVPIMYLINKLIISFNSNLD